MQLNKFLFKLYIFLLPFGTFFNLKGEGIGFWYYFTASNLVMILGMTSLFFSGYSLLPNKMLKWVNMFLYMLFYTTICACVVDVTWGECNGESPFSVIPHMCFFQGLFVFEIIYCYIAFTQLLNYKSLFPIFKVQSIILLVVGVIQYLTVNGVLFAAIINQLLSMFFCIRDTEYLLMVDHGITLFGWEPSSVASICLWLLPFVFLYAYYTRKKFYIFQCVLWTFLFLNSGSTSNVISFLTMIICLLFIVKGKIIPRIVYISSFILGITVALIYTHADLGSNDISNKDNFAYILIGKVFDVNENGSTVVRASSVVNGIKVFEEFPLTGVGDGLQGYKFNQNAPNWVQYNYSTQDLLSGQEGIVEGGGGFFGSFLSGYGFIGICILLLFIIRYKADMLLMKKDFFIQNMFGIGIIIFFYSGWYVMNLNSYLALVFCMPYVATKKSSENFYSYYFGNIKRR